MKVEETFAESVAALAGSAAGVAVLMFSLYLLLVGLSDDSVSPAMLHFR
jgi:hypothetical protein